MISLDGQKLGFFDFPYELITNLISYIDNNTVLDISKRQTNSDRIINKH